MLRFFRQSVLYLFLFGLALEGHVLHASPASVTVSNLGANQATLGLTLSETVTEYFTLLSSGSCGTASQTAAGQNSSGSAVIHGSLALTADVAGSYTVRNLKQSTAYTACFTDGESTPFSTSFTTAAGVDLSTLSWANVGSAAFSAGQARFTSLAFSPDGTPYVAYEDYGNGQKATVMKYSGAAWVTVGNAGFSAAQAYYESLAFSPDGTPYVAYMDAGNNNKATVMKYDSSSSSWVPVGGAGFSAGQASYPSLSFSPDGTPYVAYEDGGNNNKATVMKYDSSSSSWVPVGSAGFSVGQVYFPSLAFSPDGAPYLAYEDGGNSAKATVMKYSGGAWVPVGSAGFSAGTVNYLSLAFSPGGTPYLSYMDAGNSSKATVMAYNDGEWVPVGSAGFSAGQITYPSLAFSPDGTPYVAYEDGGNNNKATVMKYDSSSSSWVPVGSSDFSAGTVSYTSLAFSPNGSPYVAYMDYGNNSKATVMSMQLSGPSATTSAASTITSSSATLNGTVDDNGSATTVSFEYGTTTSYGTTVAASTGASIAAGTGSTATSVDISGLSANTTYHFRVDATGNSTTVHGSDATFTTDKATPSVKWPTASSITYGQTLASSTLSGGTSDVDGAFAWSAPSTAPPAGTYGGLVVFTPSDTNDYATVSNTVNVAVAQAVPTITTAPTGSSVIYGQTLASSTLTGGAASVPGTFTWTDSTTTVTSGTNSYAVTFTPSDTTDYTTATTTASVTGVGVTGSATNLGANQATINLTSNETGTAYFTLLNGSGTACGTVAQIVAGTDSNGNAVRHGSLALTASVSGQYTVRNLSASTAYTFCLSPDGSAGPVRVNGTTNASADLSSHSWVNVGSAGFSAGSAQFTSLAFAPDGTPYVAYEDYGNSDKTTVMKYDGSAWVTVGSAGFSAGQANYTSLAFAPDGSPYIAYEDYGNSYKATVMKYDSSSSSWVTVGSAGFSAGGVQFTSLAFAPDGSPYIAYADWVNSQKATVMKYDSSSSSWVTVGSAGFSASYVYYTSLAFSPDGTPYVAYEDYGNSYKATVMKYDGESWVTVGSAGFSAGQVYYTSLAFSPDGTPYVAYMSSGNNYKATVMQYDSSSSSWETVGSAGFSASYAYYESLAFAPDGTPYLAYMDAGNSNKAAVMKFGVQPTATTAAATNVTDSTATLNGTVNDNGSATTVSFEYGTTTSYGTTATPATNSTIAAGTGSTDVSAAISGLSPVTTYHFRVKATAASGSVVVNGDDATFTTTKGTPTITTLPTASSATYGQTLASSTLTGGTATYNNTTVAGTFTWTNSGTVLAVGTSSYSVTFTPSDTTTYQSTTVTVSLTVNKAAVSGVSLTASVNPVLVQNATTLTAAVSSSISTPTGTVTFLDGTNSLGTATLTNGVATFSASFSTSGTHSLTAQYSGDGNFLTASSSAVSEQVQDFSLSVASNGTTSQTVVPGGTATYNFTLAPVDGTTFPATVNLAVSGLPSGATYTLTPTSLAAGDGSTSVKLTIQTQKQKASLEHTTPFGRPVAPIALGLFMLPFVGRLRRKLKGWNQWVAMLLFAGSLAGAAALTGCSSTNGFMSQPEKSYTVTITGTSGALTHSTTVNLTVE